MLLLEFLNVFESSVLSWKTNIQSWELVDRNSGGRIVFSSGSCWFSSLHFVQKAFLNLELCPLPCMNEVFVVVCLFFTDELPYPKVVNPHTLLEPNVMSEAFHTGFQPYLQILSSIL